MTHTDLLCNRCGYNLGGLALDSPCPECATPIAKSLPSARPGSPWERKMSPLSFLSTSWRALLLPRSTMRKLRLDLDAAGILLIADAVAIAAITFLAVVASSGLAGGIGAVPASLGLGLALALAAGIGAMILVGLVAILLRAASHPLRYRSLSEADAAAAAHASAAAVPIYALWGGLIGLLPLFPAGVLYDDASSALWVLAFYLLVLSLVAIPMFLMIYVPLLALYARHVNRFANPTSAEHPAEPPTGGQTTSPP